MARRIQIAILGIFFAGATCLSHAGTTSATEPTKHTAPKHPETVHHSAHVAAKHPGPKSTRHYARKTKRRKRGQQAIDSGRATQIQQALVREHYLKATPSGTWDTSTQEAMRRYQADQGWQTKEVPDSRALIRLGLGPDQGHLLNPESAMTTAPQLPSGTAAARTKATASSAVTGSNAIQNSAPVATPATVVPDLSPSR